MPFPIQIYMVYITIKKIFKGSKGLVTGTKIGKCFCFLVGLS